MSSEQPTFSAQIGERIRRKRWHQRWNIADVVARLETPVDEATFGRWERGEEDIPVNMLPELVHAMNFQSLRSMLPSITPKDD